MSYVVRDPLGPALATYAYNKRFRSRILKYWPKKTIDGVQVFDRLYIYIKGQGVLQDAGRLKIYSLLGMSVEELEEQDYTGLDATYIDVPAVETVYELSDSEIIGYLADQSPRIYPNNPNVFSADPEVGADEDLNPDPYKDNLTYASIVDDSLERDPLTGALPEGVLPEPQWDSNGWMTDYVIYDPSTLTDMFHSDVVTDEDIIAKVKMANPRYVSISGAEYSSPVFFAALKDVNNVLYEKQYEVVEKRLVEKQTTTYRIGNSSYSSQLTKSKYLQSAVVRVRYRRVESPDEASVASLISLIKSDIDALNLNYGQSSLSQVINSRLSNRNPSSMQLKNMYVSIKGYTDSTLNYQGYVRVDGMANTPAREFAEVFSQALDFGYKETPAKWYEKALSIIIDIIVIIVVIVLIVFQQYWAVPIALSVGALAQAGLASYWMGQGKYAAATYAGKHAQFLGTAAEWSGFIINPLTSIVLKIIEEILKKTGMSEETIMVFKMVAQIAVGAYNGGGSEAFSEKALTEVIKNISIEQVDEIAMELVDSISELTLEAVGDAIIEAVSNMDIATFVSNFDIGDWLSLLNKAFAYYTVYMNPPAETDDLTKAIEAQTKELESLEGPEKIETVERQFSDPFDNYIDGNARLHRMCQDMTHGLNANLMNKCFDSGY